MTRLFYPAPPTRCQTLLPNLRFNHQFRIAVLVDEALTACAEPGLTFAGRLCWPADFAMTCGVVVPIGRGMLEDVLLDNLEWLRHGDPRRLADDPRLAVAIYRAALDIGIMDRVVFMAAKAAA